ncbi:MAG: tetratricopeptide repeat protein [Okeania sp. SIO3B5]|uniref:AAA-like domain-containing protein n=1 Tax=Okeania sp. SIO3B5 TaxID=2607811 RepID=UPI0013FED47D|nr:AAA-like domain-containing protein [Okeania sp. SIO3B5]NEO54698.1 tetratricopeptide repeat protein [Okeania sp. SIO3B5]
MSVSSESNFNYKVGGSLDFNYPNYIERSADIDIYKALEKGEYCYVFNGRQTGKSSLRIRTAERLKKAEFACVEIDLMAIVSEGSNVGQIYAGIVQEIASGLLLEVDCLSWWLERENLEPQERLIEFIEQVVFTEVDKNIVIFIDEVDCLRMSHLSLEAFLGLIQIFYQKRKNNPAYKRLIFALFGVVEISDFSHTIIGNRIELEGFEISAALPLAEGLLEKVDRRQEVLKEIIYWTGGQPFLTQKLCQLVLTSPTKIPTGSEKQEVAKLVLSNIIDNWEFHDEPQHLKTISNRLLNSKNSTDKLLRLYQKILQRGKISVKNNPLQTELQLAGLVRKEQGKIKIYNPIYAQIFNQSWVEKVLAEKYPIKINDHIRWVSLLLLSLASFRLLFPQLSVELNEFGTKNYLTAQYQLARFYFQCALLLKPNYKKAHYNLGSTYEKLQQFEKARNEYNIAEGISEAYSNLARLCIQDKKYSEAINLLEKGLQKKKAKTDPLLRYALLKNMGWVLLEQQRYPEAESYLSEAIKLMDTRAIAYKLLARLLEAKGDREKARTIWQKFRQYALNESRQEYEY